MTALTKLMKSVAVRKAVTQAMGQREVALEKAKQLFVDGLYLDRRGALGFAEIASSPHAKQWLAFTTYAEVYLDGHRTLKANTSKSLPLFSCERYNAMISLRVVKGDAFSARLLELLAEAKELAKDTAELTTSVEALLAPIKTFAQFRTAWPEGVSLLPPEPAKAYTLVDAKLMLSVNALVGLPPEVAGE